MNKVILSLSNGKDIGFTCAGMQHATNGIKHVSEDNLKELIKWIDESEINEHSVECNSNLKVKIYRNFIVYVEYQKVR